MDAAILLRKWQDGANDKKLTNLDRDRDKLNEFDAVGRMRVAKGGLAAGATGVTANWSQSYSYVRYGTVRFVRILPIYRTGAGNVIYGFRHTQIIQLWFASIAHSRHQ